MFKELRNWSAWLTVALAAAGCGGGGGGDEGPDASALDRRAPEVTYVTPSNGANDAGTNTRLTVTFSESMDPGTLEAAIELVETESRVPVELNVEFDNKNHIATLTPRSPLAPNFTYRAQVSTSAKDLAGNALANAYAWTFGTAPGADTVAPTLTSFAPAAGATQVAPRSAVAMSFSEPMDAGSVNRAFTLTRDGAAVAGRMAYVGQAAVFTPDAALAAGATYAAKLSREATDLAGIAFAAEHAWQFSVIAAADSIPPGVLDVSPADGATQVPRDPTISVRFSEPIYPFVYGAIDGVLVEVAIDYGNNTVSMRPTGQLKGNAEYQGSVQARDLAGNTMAPFGWHFFTAP